MTLEFIVFLALLQIKHWYVDFVNQSDAEVKSKGIYGDFHGIMHSAKHGIGTSLCVLLIAGYTYIIYAIIMGIMDAVAHYHIDWTKMNYGNRDISKPEFWNHLGLDQMAHQFCYIFLAYLMS